jgi:HD-GYP domain-containing protein (c-di-GMP phosphodiesterase class II)
LNIEFSIMMIQNSKFKIQNSFPQPVVALIISLVASAALGGAWLISGPASYPLGTRPGDLLVAAVLACWVAAGYQFPIHVGRCQKIEMITISLYLMAVLLPVVPLACTGAALGILAGEMLVRAKRGNYYGDVATATGRWTIVMLAGATFSHATGSHSALSLLGTAAIMWVGDAVTAPLAIAPMTGDRPVRFMLSNVRASALAEGAQYLLGVLGALAGTVEIWALGLLVPPTILVYMALKSVKEVRSNTRLMLESLADTVDLRDPCTGGHSQRVAEMTARILRTIGLGGLEVELIVLAARVHDIGKIGVPDYILNKPGRLTPEEDEIMRTHPDRGADLLQRYPDFTRGVEIIRHHHENWDGTGYPQGLKGIGIPFGARVIAVADSYDAMTSNRPYREAMTQAKAAMILHEGRGTQWDPQIVDAFLQSIATQAAREEPDSRPVLQAVPQLM